MNETIGPETAGPSSGPIGCNAWPRTCPASSIRRPWPEQAVAQVQAALDADAGVVFLLSPDGASLQIAHASGYEARTSEPWTRFPLTANLPVTDAVRTREAVLVALARRSWSSGTRSWPPRRARSSAAPGPPFRW